MRHRRITANMGNKSTIVTTTTTTTTNIASIFVIIIIAATNLISSPTIVQVAANSLQSRSYNEVDPPPRATDPQTLVSQRELVKHTGSLDVLGDIEQYPNGRVETLDFGKNVHRFPETFGDDHDEFIFGYEKIKALRRIEDDIFRALIRMIKKRIRALEKGLDITQRYPTFVL